MSPCNHAPARQAGLHVAGLRQLQRDPAAIRGDNPDISTRGVPRALAGGSAGHDARHDATEAMLTRIADRRDRLATEMKGALARAAAGDAAGHGRAVDLVAQAHRLVRKAERRG